MLKKTITYSDYNGVNRTEDFMFNLSKAELMEMEMGTTGGFSQMVNGIISAQDAPAMIKIFKDLILKSYGVKTPDGKGFRKSEELSKAFSETEAYSQLFMELVTDDKAAAAFINGILPSDIAADAAKAIEENPDTPMLMPLA